MRVRLPAPSWRIAASAFFSLIFVVASLGVVGAGSSNSNRAASKPVQIAASGRGVAPMKGTVDLAKLPTIKAGAQTTIQSAPPPQRLDPLTPEQRAAYEAGLKHATNLPSASAGTPLPQAKISPNFIGGSKIPLLTKNVDGLSSVEAGAPFVVASPTVATDLGYVMEGVSESFAIYRASDGSRAFGPYLESSFFAPVFHGPNDLFSNTLMDYDVMRDRWIVVAVEGSSNGPPIWILPSARPPRRTSQRLAVSITSTRFLRRSAARGVIAAVRDSASSTTRSLLPAAGLALAFSVTRRS